MSTPTNDTQFGRAVVEHHLATPEEVRACLKRQAELAKQGKHVPLWELMIEAGYVTRSQVKRLAEQGLLDDSMTRSARQIPGYEILGKVGQGAMATVWKARQLSLDRIVAIKILPKRFSDNPEFVERFYKEGKAAAKLNHPNIVQAIDVGEAGGYHYFVMEYVDGHTVYDELAKGKVYDEQEALDIIIQVAKALSHAHKRGLIHRDVKPKNIMITKDGVVKLADLGLVRQVGDKEAAMAEAGRAYGTPYYISPEQIRGEVDIDARADIYSLGATFYHMVTGRVPFDGPTPSAVMHKHLKEPLIPPDHINTSLSAGVAEVIEVMMAKNRDERYASADDLLLDLEAVKRGEPPLQARKKVDPKLLASLAKAERAAAEQEERQEQQITAPEAAEPAPLPARTDWTVTIVLGILLGLSVLTNIVLLVLRAL